MDEQSTKQVIDALKPLADKLGQSAAEIYGIYTRQMIVEGVAALIVDALWLFIIYLLYRGVRHLWSNREAYNHTFDIWPMFAFGGIGAIITLGLIATISMQQDLGKIINPQYYAIDRMITTVRGDGN